MSETLLGRASHLGGDRMFDRASYEPRPDAARAIERFGEGAAEIALLHDLYAHRAGAAPGAGAAAAAGTGADPGPGDRY